MKRAKSIISLLLTLVLLFNMVPFASAADPDVTLKVTPSVTSIEKSSGTANVVYTISLVPKSADVQIVSFQFDLVAPDGMTLATSRSAKGGAGYWIAATDLLYVPNYDDPSLDKGIFTAFNYAPTTGNFDASGGIAGTRYLNSEQVVMTISATVDISSAAEYTLGVNNFKCYKDGSTAIPNSVVEVGKVNVVNAPITSVSVMELDTPATGATPDTTVTIAASGIVFSITSWYEGNAVADDKLISDTATYKFKGGSVYTVQLTLNTDTGYAFGSSVTAEGYTVARVSDTQITLTKTFDATDAATVSSVAISGDASAAVPTKAEAKTTVSLTASATYNDGSVEDKTSAATWNIEPAYSGVSVDGGVVTILPAAAAGTVTVKATYDGKEDTHDIVLSKGGAVLTTMEISAQPADPKVPYSGLTSTVTLSAVGYDQYGGDIAVETPVWTFSDGTTTAAGMMISGNTLTIEPTAAAGTVTVKVTSGSVTATKDISVAKDATVLKSFAVSGEDTVAVPYANDNNGSKTVTYAAISGVDQYGAAFDLTGKSFTWSIEGAAPAGVSISSDGKLTITKDAAAVESMTIKATYADNAAVVATKSVKITKESPALTTITAIGGDATVAVPYVNDNNGSKTVTYTVTSAKDQYGADYTPAGGDTFTWTIDGENTTGVEISADGKLTVTNSDVAGTVTVKVTGNGDVTATKAVAITKEAPKPAKATISGGVTTMSVPTVVAPGAEETATADTAFTVTVKDQYGAAYDMTNDTIDWAIDGTAPVGVSVVDGYLKVTNKASTVNVKVKATVTGTSVSCVSDTIAITKAGQVVTFVKLNKNTDSITIPVEGNPAASVTYTATTYDQYGAPYSAGTTEWSAVNLPTSVTQNGATVTVPAGASEGTMTLTATNNGKSDSVTINVQNKPLHQLSGAFVNKEYTYDGATVTQTVTCTTDGVVKYTSSAPEVVAVNETTGALTINKVGSATITASVEETTAYAPVSMSYTVTVKAKPITITGVSATSRQYDSANTSVALTGGTLVGVKSGDDVAFTLGNGTIANVNAGTQNVTTNISLTGTAKDNYTLTQPTGITVVITKAENPITGLSCADVTFGTAPAPAGATAVNGTVSYRYCATQGGTYSDWNTENAVGTYWVEAYVAESDNYKAGSAKLSFKVNAKDLSEATFASIEAAPYTGSAIAPKPVVTLGSKTLVEGTDFTYSYANNTYVGTASVNVVGKGNYSGSATTAATFNITAVADPAVISTTATVKMGGNTVDLSKNVTGAKGTMSYEVIAGSGAVDANGIYTSPDAAGEAKVKVTVAAKDMNNDGNNEYTGKTETITITINEKDNAALTVNQTGCTYGETLADPTYTTPDGTFVSETVTYSGADYAESAVKPTEAGSYTVKVVYETKTVIYTGTQTFTIAPKALSSDMIAAISAETFSGSAITPEPTVTYGSKTLVKDTDFTYSYANNTNAGTAKVTITAVANGNYSGSAEKTFTIKAKPIAITSATATERTYNGEKGVEISSVTFDGATLTKNADYTVVGTMDDANAGNDKNVSVVVALLNTNYSLAEFTTTTTVTINQATAQDIPNQNVKLVYTVSGEQSVSIAGLMPNDAGDIAYAKGTESVSGSTTVDSWDVSAAGLVTYKLSGSVAGDTVTMPVTISSTNYSDVVVDVVVTITDKKVPVVNANDITVTYNGEAVSASAITGTATYEDAEVAGVWSFSAAAPKDVNQSSNAVIVVFTPDKTDEYETVQDTISVTINKAKPAGTPTYTKVTESGKTLADANLTVGTITPEGTIKWVADNGTEVEKNKAYGWLFTPVDTDNYESLIGEITVWEQQGGGYFPGYYPTVKPETPAETKPTTPTEPSTPVVEEITVPISSDEETIHVDASVSGDKATIDHVDLNKLESVIGDDVEVGTVTVDFSTLDTPLTQVEIPADVVKEIAAAVADPDNKAESLEVILSDGLSIEFDAVALSEKAKQADGADITISILPSERANANEKQKETIGGRPFYDVSVTSGGEHISDMGGHITIHAPYELQPGEDARGITVWYVDDNGQRERCETKYDSAKQRVSWTTNHLSVYMIDYDESLVPAEDIDTPDTTPDVPDETPADSVPVLWIVLGIIALLAVIVIVVLLAKRKKK